MGFAISCSHNTEVTSEIREALRKAEKKNQTEITFEKPFWMNSDCVGQILHDVKFHYEKNVKLIKDVWQITACDKRNITCKVVDSDYLPKKRIIITEKDKFNIVHRESHGLLHEGKFAIKSNGDYARVLKIYIGETEDKELTQKNPLQNPHQTKILKDAIFVEYEYEAEERIETDSIENIKFDGTDSVSLKKFLEEYHIITENDIVQHEKNMLYIEETGKLAQFGDVLMIGDGKAQSIAEQETSKALVGLNSKEHLEQVHSKMAVRQNEAMVITANMQRSLALQKEKLDLVMERKRQELSTIMQKLNTAVALFEKEMQKIHRLITTLEIYMGVHEDVLQIGEGEAAPTDAPICLRQMQLYMDEEVASTQDQGIDFERIEEFDEWLVKGGYKRVAPESKCVVIMRPRRNMKDRPEEHYMIRNAKEEADQKAYIVIRNGLNLYRIWTDNIEKQPRLFPKKDELQAMFTDMHELEEKLSLQKDGYYANQTKESIEKIEKKIFRYKKNMLLLQGIVMRTQIFAPLPLGLNILDVNTHGDHINFIYDEEMTLPDGRMRFDKWLAEINKSIKKGSRIFFADIRQGGANHFKNRFSLNWYHDHSAPPMPNEEVYEVKMVKEDRSELVTSWISKKELDKNEAYWEKIKKKYSTTKKSAYGGTSTQYHDIPESEYKKMVKYEDTNYRRNGNQLKHDEEEKVIGDIVGNAEYAKVSKYVRDETTGEWKPERKRWVEEVLRISYNPGDKVYKSWGDRSGGDYEHERKTNITFVIKPTEDKFIINYDALLIEDIDFYLENRIDRQGYLKMMPVLRGLKKRLIAEKEEETKFVEALSQRIAAEVKLEATQVEPLIWKAVEWWKNEIVTVWKRPIAKDDAKAWRMITQETKRLIKGEFKIKIDTGVYNKNKVLIWKKDAFTAYIGTDFHKADFHEALMEGVSFRSVSTWKTPTKYDGKTKAQIGREISETTNEEYKKLAEAQKGKIIAIKL